MKPFQNMNLEELDNEIEKYEKLRDKMLLLDTSGNSLLILEFFSSHISKLEDFKRGLHE